MDKLIDLLLSRTVLARVKTYIDGLVGELVTIVTGMNDDIADLEERVSALETIVAQLSDNRKTLAFNFGMKEEEL